MKIEILGTGCAKCKTLAERTEAAAKRIGCAYEMVKVTDIDKIISYGVMMTPALVIDGTVVISGKVPSDRELQAFISAHMPG